MLAYLILIGINQNEQRVKAIAANSRRSTVVVPRSRLQQPVSQAVPEPMDVGSEPVPSTSAEGR